MRLKHVCGFLLFTMLALATSFCHYFFTRLRKYFGLMGIQKIFIGCALFCCQLQYNTIARSHLDLKISYYFPIVAD